MGSDEEEEGVYSAAPLAEGETREEIALDCCDFCCALGAVTRFSSVRDPENYAQACVVCAKVQGLRRWVRQHDWRRVGQAQWESCVRCGVVRRADAGNGECRSAQRIGLRG